MTSHFRILLVSLDRRLLQSRKLIIGTYFHVEAAGRMPEVVTLFKSNTFHLAILCHTLTHDQLRNIADLANSQACPPKILMIPRPEVLIVSAERKELARSISRQEVTSFDNPLSLLKRSAAILGLELQKNVRIYDLPH